MKFFIFSFEGVCDGLDLESWESMSDMDSNRFGLLNFSLPHNLQQVVIHRKDSRRS